MAKSEIDCDKLRVHLRRLRKEDLLNLLDSAIDLVPKTRLPALVKDILKPQALRPDGSTKGGLLEAVSRFREASLRGEYYEDFMVNSKNYMEKSPPLPAPSDAEVVAPTQKIERKVLSRLGLTDTCTDYVEQQDDPLPFQSPHCQGKRELVAMITETPMIRAFLKCLELPADPPVPAEARWPEGLFEHT